MPGKSYWQRRPAGYSPWGHKRLDMTYQLNNSKRFPLYPLSVGFFFFLSWMDAEFCWRLFLYLFRIFSFTFVNMVYHVDLFMYIEEPFQNWDKSHLIMCMILLMCCWILFASILLRILASIFTSVVFFFVISLSGFGIWVMVIS